MTQASLDTTTQYRIPISDDMFALLQETAQQEGRQVQAILNEALHQYFAAYQRNNTRHHVEAALQASMKEFDTLYDKLSK